MSRKRAVQRTARRGMRRIEGAAGSPAPRDPLHEGRDPFFSTLLESGQPGHELVTHGPYRYVRHPSYLGMMLGFVGWALVFRSSVGLVSAVLGLRLLFERIESEEALLASHFGDAYADYRRRSWRLVPWLY